MVCGVFFPIGSMIESNKSKTPTQPLTQGSANAEPAKTTPKPTPASTEDDDDWSAVPAFLRRTKK